MGEPWHSRSMRRGSWKRKMACRWKLSTCGPCCRSIARPFSQPPGKPEKCWWCTKIGSPAGSAAKLQRWSASSPSSTSTDRSAGLPRSTRIPLSAPRWRKQSFRAPTRSSTQFGTWQRTDMAIEVAMPQMGESVVEGTVTKWLVKEGDLVKEDQPLCEISTDKVDTEIPSPGAGRIAKIVAQEGATIPVGGQLAIIEERDGVRVP